MDSFAEYSLNEDKFSKGEIVKFFPQLRYGFVRNHKGEDLYFNLDHVRIIEEKKHKPLSEGLKVGFDVSRTAKGLHVYKIKIY